LLSRCATDVHSDSASQGRFLEDSGVCTPGRIQIFGSGSISGVNIRKFSTQPGRRQRVRASLGIKEDSIVFMFLGRMQRDKGLLILADAFAQILEKKGDAILLLVGPDEEQLTSFIKDRFVGKCHWIGLTPAPEDYLDAADVLCLPSFREGFGTVIIEAAAMGIPAVASRIYGLTDAVIDGETGLLCSPGNAVDLANAMEKLMDPSERERLGKNARTRAHQDFPAEKVTAYWREYYRLRLEPLV
ncbi:MAG: glycosyltransferase, partial [Alphaproteobacteria bacterium]